MEAVEPLDWMCPNCVTPYKCNGPHIPFEEFHNMKPGSFIETTPERLAAFHKDLVNHPPHYKNHPSGIECIQITEHMNFCLGNAMKYIWRAGDKHETPLEDLKKAKWYIEREIARLEKE